ANASANRSTTAIMKWEDISDDRVWTIRALPREKGDRAIHQIHCDGPRHSACAAPHRSQPFRIRGIARGVRLEDGKMGPSFRSFSQRKRELDVLLPPHPALDPARPAPHREVADGQGRGTPAHQ